MAEKRLPGVVFAFSLMAIAAGCGSGASTNDDGAGGAAGDGGGGAGGLDGALAEMSTHCCTSPPSAANQVGATRSATVGPGVEFPSMTTSGTIIGSSVDVSSASIHITYTEANTAVAGAFNGDAFHFSGTNLPVIAGATLDPATTVPLDATRISFDGSDVFVNGASIQYKVGDQILIDLTFQ